MAPRLRRMKKYRPRKRRTKKEMNKQLLGDLTHKINTRVGDLLVLLKEGQQTQAQEAQQRAKNEFLKVAPQVHIAAQSLGEKWVHIVDHYIKSVDLLVHSNPICIDPKLIHDCYEATERLEKELHAA